MFIRIALLCFPLLIVLAGCCGPAHPAANTTPTRPSTHRPRRQPIPPMTPQPNDLRPSYWQRPDRSLLEMPRPQLVVAQDQGLDDARVPLRRAARRASPRLAVGRADDAVKCLGGHRLVVGGVPVEAQDAFGRGPGLGTRTAPPLRHPALSDNTWGPANQDTAGRLPSGG